MTGTPRRILRLPTAALITIMLAVSGLPSLSATGSGDPEITDARGDPNPGAFFLDNPENAEVFQNLTAYDLLAVYVLLETQQSFLVEFAVADLPESWAVPPNDATDAGPNATNPAAQLVANFTIEGVTYEAVATLAAPSASGVVDSYELRPVGGDETALAGAIDPEADTVTLLIPKALVGSPEYGDKMTQFRAEGRFAEQTLDFAPDAVNFAPGSPDAGFVQIVLNKLSGQQVVEPQYGEDYTFGNYAGGASGDVRLESVITQKTIESGQTALYYITVKNQAPAADTIHLTASTASAGVAHHLGDAHLFLGAGGEQIVELRVITSQTVHGTLASTVNAVTQLGDAAKLDFFTTVESPDGGDGGNGGEGGDGGDGGDGADDGGDGGSGDEKSDRKGDSPGLGLVVGAVVVTGAAWALRRRK